MEVHVNWLAVVLAVVAKMVVGMVWYARPVFGDIWAKEAGLDDKKMQSGAGKAIAQGLVTGFITAYVLAHVVYLSNAFFNHSFLQDALSTALWVRLGFAAAIIITHNAFEQKTGRLTLLAVGNELVTLLAMGLVIGLLRP